MKRASNGKTEGIPTLWTLVQHSGHHKPGFDHAVEEAA